MGKGNEALQFEAPVKGIQLVTYSRQINEVNIKQGLLSLLCDCVDSGASVGFIRPFTLQQAEQYWREVQMALNDGNKYLLIAASEANVLGCVQLSLCHKANGLHRAEVEKLMVHTQARGQGVAKRLMIEVEALATNLCRSLLVLDTKKGDIAENMYANLGYVRGGEIPGFALSSTGELDATVLFYKRLMIKAPFTETTFELADNQGLNR